MREEMLKDTIEFQEELMIQNERLVEIGQKLYFNHNFMERKFVQNTELEIKLNALNEIVSQIGIEAIQDRLMSRIDDELSKAAK